MYPDNQFHDGRVAPPLIYGPSYQDYQHSVFRLATAPPIMNQTINHNYYFGEGHYGYKSEFRQQETHHWNCHQKLPKDKTARLTSDAGSQYTCRSCDCKDCLEERTAKTVFRGMTDSEKHVFLSGRFGKREDERFEDDVQQEVDKMMLNVNGKHSAL